MENKSYYLCYQYYGGATVIDVRKKLNAKSRREARKEAEVFIQEIRDKKRRTGDWFALKEEIIIFNEARLP
ncbi:MAG: hypothetical protein HYV47_01285 [Candidatus Nealsonbacteria bacterium]|nr:hypothetical protein [Candidatus Nealsonbacteria bacterium]